jgi:hypothetical protein
MPASALLYNPARAAGWQLLPPGPPRLLRLPRGAALIALREPLELACACSSLAWLDAQAPRLRIVLEEGQHHVMPERGYVYLSAPSGRSAAFVVQPPTGPAAALRAWLGRRTGSPRSTHRADMGLQPK